MEIQISRIDSYDDDRFSKKVLRQHGAFIVNKSMVYEVEIISQNEAIIRGNPRFYKEVIGEFRFFSYHITKFYDEERNIVIEFEDVPMINVSIDRIQPSQFYVDSAKKIAVESFINTEGNVIIPLVEYGDRYISMDGHTRLCVAIEKNFKSVKGIIVEGDEWLYKFVEEAIKRNVRTPYDLELLNHEDYDIKWNRFCDEFFAQE